MHIIIEGEEALDPVMLADGGIDHGHVRVTVIERGESGEGRWLGSNENGPHRVGGDGCAHRVGRFTIVGPELDSRELSPGALCGQVGDGELQIDFEDGSGVDQGSKKSTNLQAGASQEPIAVRGERRTL